MFRCGNTLVGERDRFLVENEIPFRLASLQRAEPAAPRPEPKRQLPTSVRNDVGNNKRAAPPSLARPGTFAIPLVHRTRRY